MRRMMSEQYLDKFPDEGADQDVDDMWLYHKWISYTTNGGQDRLHLYNRAPASIEEFCEAAQLVNYVSM